MNYSVSIHWMIPSLLLMFLWHVGCIMVFSLYHGYIPWPSWGCSPCWRPALTSSQRFLRESRSTIRTLGENLAKKMPRFPTKKGEFRVFQQTWYGKPSGKKLRVPWKDPPMFNRWSIYFYGPCSVLNNQRVSIILSGLYMLIILDGL